MKDLLRKLNVFTVLIAILTFTLGWQLGRRDIVLQWASYHPTVNIKNKQPPKEIEVDFKLFWDTWDLVSRKYLDKAQVDPQKLFFGSIQGMVAALGDPYTVFLPPDQQKSSKE
ncbi:MAG: carboxyl-terminal processing protease, partial [Microgenomates group bacterium Gr01-1014_80]